MTEKEENEPLAIWDTPYRRDGKKESNVAFECFLYYRNLGAKRNLTKVAKYSNTKYETIRDWSSRYKWNTRIKEMNEYKIRENNKINEDIKRREINRINARLDAKSKLLNVLTQILINNSKNFEKEKLDLKEFSNLLNMVARIENMNISDLESLANIEKILTASKADATAINEMVNNFNVLLAVNNSDAISQYEEKIKDDKY